MPIVTPDAKNHAGLPALASRYVDVAALPWVATRFPGVDMKLLMEDKDRFARALVSRLSSFAMRRMMTSADERELEQIVRQVRSSDYRLKDIVLAITLSPLFRSR